MANSRLDGHRVDLARIERERNCDDGIQAIHLLYLLSVKTKPLHIVCFALLLGILWLPLLQETTGLFQEKPLAGVENPQDTVMLTGPNWFSKKFQENYVMRQYQWMGLRPSMVRLRNQVDYSIFREPYYSVLVGRDGELFGRASLEAMQGKEFVGQAKVDYNSRNTAILQNHFAQRGVQMLTVITPQQIAVHDGRPARPRSRLCRQLQLRRLHDSAAARAREPAGIGHARHQLDRHRAAPCIPPHGHALDRLWSRFGCECDHCRDGALKRTVLHPPRQLPALKAASPCATPMPTQAT